MPKAKPKLMIVSRNDNILDEKSLELIPLAHIQVYTFTREKQLMAKRRFIYSVNSNNAAGRRYRTIREHLTLGVLRIS